MKLAKIFFMILLSVMSYSFVFGEEGKTIEQDVYPHFSKIQGFYSIEVKLFGKKNIGLSENELTDFAKLKFKNNFGGKYTLSSTQVDKIPKKGRGEKLGYIWFGVSIVGKTDYPVAYHIQCRAGNFSYFLDNFPTSALEDLIIWENAILGYDNKINVPTKIKECISELMEDLAIVFFKARGEL